MKSNFFMITHQDYKSKIISPRKTFKLPCCLGLAPCDFSSSVFTFKAKPHRTQVQHPFSSRMRRVPVCRPHAKRTINAHLNNGDNDERSVLLLWELTLKRCRQNIEVSERDSKAMVSFIPEMPSHYDQVTTRELSRLGHKHPVRNAPLWVFASNTPRVKLTNKTNEQGQEGCMQEVPAAKHTKTSFMFSKCLLFVSSFSPQEY